MAPRFRSYIPERWTVYRITVPLPMTVEFPSIAYRLSFESIEYAGHRHELQACEFGRACPHVIGERYLSRVILEEDVTQLGFRVRAATVGDTIMRRLVREGRAEVLSDRATRELVPPRLHR